MRFFDFEPRTRVVFGEGAITRLGELSRQLGFKRTLLVADPGMVEAGHVERATVSLRESGVHITYIHAFASNPDSRMVEDGRSVGVAARIDSLLAVGGGSLMDCAKGINFLLSGSAAHILEYRGYGKV